MIKKMGNYNTIEDETGFEIAVIDIAGMFRPGSDKLSASLVVVLAGYLDVAGKAMFDGNPAVWCVHVTRLMSKI